MDDFYNLIQYVVPQKSDVLFRISPETRKVSVKLLGGAADIYVNEKRFQLLLHQEFSLQLWNCLNFLLKSKADCNFLVRGNHYVSSTVLSGLEACPLFCVYPSEDSYSFVLEKDIQLQIFPVESTQQESPITIRSTRGAPEIDGFRLSNETSYSLTPYYPVLLKSSDDKPYSVYVKGFDRKVKLSILDENRRKYENDVKSQILDKRFLTKRMNQTILVLGPKNVGKTSFCRSLLHELFEKKITPVYIDLNIGRNLCVPGSVCLSIIRRREDSAPEFKNNIENILYFGSTQILSADLQSYYHLIRKMGTFLWFYLNDENKENCLSIIDTDGSQVTNNKVLEHILNYFYVDLVVYIGDEHYYTDLKNSILANVPSEFIPKPRNTEQPNDFYETKFYQHRIREYFFGLTTNLSSSNVCTVSLHVISIYRISQFLHPNNPNPEFIRIDFNGSVNPKLLKCLFAFSAAKEVEFCAMTEVKYYLYFTEINMYTETATVTVPTPAVFEGGILLMLYIPTVNCSQII